MAHSSPVSEPLLQAAFDQLNESIDLSDNERHLLHQLDANTDTLISDINEMKKVSRPPKSRDCLDKLANIVSSIDPFVSVVHSPGVKVVLGAVKLLINLAQKAVSLFEKVTDALEQLSHRMRYFGDYARLYSDDEHVSKALTQIYFDIFQLCLTVRRMFFNKHGKPRHRICLLYRSAFNGKVDECIKTYGQHFQILKGARQHADLMRQRRLEQEAADRRAQEEREREKRRQELAQEAAERERRRIQEEREREEQRKRQVAEAAELRIKERAEKEARRKQREQEEERRREEDKRRTCRDSLLARLKTVPMEDEHDKINAVAADDSGTWFLQTESFSKWMRGDVQSLWCYGKPGCGKTVLASVVISHLRREFPEAATAFFYCSFRSVDRRDSTTMLHTMASQVLSLRPPSAPVWARVVDDGRYSAAHISLAAVRDVLCEAAQTHDSPSFMIIDGLDECLTEDRETLLSALVALQAKYRLLIFSRFEEHLGQSEVLSTATHYQVQPSAVTPDIERYIRRSIERSIETQKLIKLEESTKSELLRGIVDKADGMFLWASLQLRDVCQERTEDAVRKAVRNLPHGLEETYAQILRKIDQLPSERRERVKSLLRWVVCAPGRLYKSALGGMVAAPSMTAGWDSSKVPDPDSVIRDCYNLVDYAPEDGDGHIPRVCHFSVMEFLSSHPDGYSGTVAAYHFHPALDHLVILAESCITVIMLSYYIHPPTDATTFALLSWAYPLLLPPATRMRTEYKKRIRNAMRELSRLWKGAYWEKTPNWPLVAGDANTALPLLDDHACYLCLKTAYGLPDSFFADTPKGDKCVSALHIAVSGAIPDVTVVQALLQAGASPTVVDKRKRTPLHYAVMERSGCDSDVVAALLEADADPNALDEFNQAPLHYAIAKNDVEIVGELVRHRASLTARDLHGQTPHMQALRNRAHPEILELLSGHPTS
ncbi:hypothetical protein PUNSTDRAFT_143324 [Punctularia strigosozonata HHB-11173 SS5]|uniref:uncharacterized protein n=1 Tax=Punctularia strigosozonata (strain HHB-11173) TaxID=741275 RepID=UPI000441637A|nr:uncharacterized protein PUNSTDRAFT_143324 [Punctularia strigosozonata HHB-11173 SS5]EIN09936.1 hypothetical protein PUNSTDRAFT_143324 [Punctularia strigosozonata HHB-11173 SS5]